MKIEEIILAKKLAGGSSPSVDIEQLSVTENGTYSEQGKAYSPVIVEVPEPTLITKSITANGTYSASDDNADGYSSVTVAVDGFKKKSIANTPTDIASFNDGTANPMPSLEISIDPVQDLHGYDYPWVGGAGKNKLQNTAQSKTEAGITYTVNNDGTITVSGTATAYSSLAIGRARVSSSMGNITISGIASATNIIWAGCYVYDENNQLVVNITNGSTDPSITFDLSSYTNAYYLSVSVKRSDNVATSGTIKPQIEVGNVATSFAPYENICPISGHTEADVTRCGKNYFDKTTAQIGYINDATGEAITGVMDAKCTDFIRVLPNTSYYIKSEQRIGMWGAYYDENKKYISGVTGYANNVSTTPSNAKYVRLTVLCNDSGNINTFGINYPSTDTSYHAYQGSTTSIPFHDSSDNPITVYGGTLDVTSGELRVTHRYVDLGTLLWSGNVENNHFYTSLNSTPYDKSRGNEIICSCYKNDGGVTAAPYYGDSGTFKWWASPSLAWEIYVTDETEYESIDAFKTAMSGQILCYPLATPQTYQLTPAQVSTLLGQNNIFADCGQILEGEYFVTL